MDPLLLSLPAAFGLAAASGLNASVPLLLVSLAARLGLLHLVHPYDALASDVAFYGLLVLATGEFLVDKVPVLDSVGHTVGLPLATTSGAILFASQTGTVDRVDPGLQVLLSLGAGGGTAAVVHVARASMRPVLNLGLLGPVASVLEDAGAVALVVAVLTMAVLLPVLVVGASVGLLWLWQRRRARQEALAMGSWHRWSGHPVEGAWPAGQQGGPGGPPGYAWPAPTGRRTPPPTG
jgi:hypothetical protein